VPLISSRSVSESKTLPTSGSAACYKRAFVQTRLSKQHLSLPHALALPRCSPPSSLFYEHSPSRLAGGNHATPFQAEREESSGAGRIRLKQRRAPSDDRLDRMRSHVACPRWDSHDGRPD
jgi:hypothetical protein